MRLRVFVVMPYGCKEARAAVYSAEGRLEQPAIVVDFNAVYQKLIRPALERVDCEPFRDDEGPGAGDIRTDIFFELVTADFVLADVSILNPNVFYELGVRHGVAPRGVLLIHGGWTSQPFDIRPDRLFSYDGGLFALSNASAPAVPPDKLVNEVESLTAWIREAIRVDDRSVGSPVYKELPGLRPVDWTKVETARFKFFRGVLDEWRRRVDVARHNGRPGDILTLAGDAPTRYHQAVLLLESARGLIDLRQYAAAEPVLEQVVDLVPTSADVDVQSLLGLVRNRLGRSAEAAGLMEQIAEEQKGHPEVQGVLGRVYKDMWRSRWEQIADLQERQRAAVVWSAMAASAIRSYEVAQRHRLDSYYNGINVITLVRLLEHLQGATGQAPVPSGVTDVDALIAVTRMAATGALQLAMYSAQLEQQKEVAWAAATLGELAVLAGEPEKARGSYLQAVGAPGLSYFQVDSMRTQLRLLEDLSFPSPALAPAVEVIQAGLQRFAAPKGYSKVVICSGHMVDEPGREQPRFPPEKEGRVHEEISRQLDLWGIGPGDLALCGGARGADILFGECCRDRGAHVRLNIPLPVGEFLDRSVRLSGPVDWEGRFEALRRSSECCFQPDRLGLPPEGMSPFERNNLWIINTARVEASSGMLYAILVWDERPAGDGPGGTTHFAAEVKAIGGRLKVVNPMTF